MIKIIDSGASRNDYGFGTKGVTTIDRAIYNRLQSVSMVPLGTDSKDNVPPISTFIRRMEELNNNGSTTDADIAVDDFFGSLGVTQYYPHPDNTYKGVLS